MELTSAQVDLWFHYEEIAMHFNELIIQYRLQLMGGTGAIGAVAAYLILGKEDVVLRSSLRVLFSCLMLILLVAAAFLDLFYYNKLLDGAVVALLEFEKNHPEINMSTYIHAEVQNWAKPAIWLWYAAIIVPLGIFAGFSFRADRRDRNKTDG